MPTPPVVQEEAEEELDQGRGKLLREGQDARAHQGPSPWSQWPGEVAVGAARRLAP
jgi:hypothetical protein